MGRLELKKERRARAKRGLKKKIRGSSDRPRLVIFRSLRHIYGAIVDDTKSKTILQVSSLNKEIADQLKAREGENQREQNCWHRSGEKGT